MRTFIVLAFAGLLNTLTVQASKTGSPFKNSTSKRYYNQSATATISYAGSPYCSSAGTASVTLTGTTGGTFSSDAGLSINASTGAVNLSASSAGTHTVTYTIAANGVDPAFSTTTNITITTQPYAEGFFPANPYCSNIGTLYPTGRKEGIDGIISATPAGLSIDPHYAIVNVNNSTPGSYTVYYNVPAYGGCAAYQASAPLIISTAPSATINYSSSAFCKSVTTVQTVNFSGSTGGTYSASPSGLTINSTTGEIIPSTSTAGTYTVTYSMAAREGCSIQTAKTTVTITAIPNATISYTGTPYCSSAGTASVTLTGTTGGTFSSDGGLSINASTGAVNLSASSAGTHTVTYKITAKGGCSAFSTSTSITITTQPYAEGFFPANPYCSNIGTLYPTGRKEGIDGIISATPAGLSIDPHYAIVNVNNSTPGSYTVYYNVPAYGGCAAYQASAPLIISTAPSATIKYTGSPFCKSVTTAQTVNFSGSTGGTYSASPSGLTINSSTGEIIPSTSTAGTYTVTYSMAAREGCSIQTAKTTVTITAIPNATISYTGTPYCSSAGTASVSLSGTSGGTFSSDGGLSINASTGAVNLSASSAGTHTVTYKITANGGCSAFSTSTNITITTQPYAEGFYPANPYCSNIGILIPTGTKMGIDGTISATPAGLSVDSRTAVVNVNKSQPGSYTVSYNVPAYGGCAAYTASAPLIISTAPSASITYENTPFCVESSNPEKVTLTGTTGGVFSATGITVNTETGDIVPSSNSAGSYTINYKLPAADGCAAFSTSTKIYIGTPGTWTGKADGNWNNTKNWICGEIPTLASNTTIPATSNNPVIPTGIFGVNNITINNGASLTVHGTLQIAGNIGNNGAFDVTNGTLEFDGGSQTVTGPTAQTISGSWFVNKTINNLVVSNTKGLSLFSTANDTLNITGVLSFGKSNCTFNTNNNLTLKSTATATATVADITGNGALKGNSITGNVTVERYINIGNQPGQHNKTWVMVATPTEGKSIYQTWMENGDKSIVGYGTQITGKGTGFDASSAAPALKYYSDVTNNWVGVTNTSDPVYNQLGYMLFVRGDRATGYPNISNTTLRTSGTLLTGTTTPMDVKAGKFQSIGNPYASAVDIRKISASGINPDIIVWDPTLTIGNPYGVGAYQTLYKDGDNYRNLLPSPTFGPAGTVNNNIESGVAFFVQSFNTDGQVYFTESAKAPSAGKGIAMREQTSSDDIAGLSARLFVVNTNGSSYVADGVLQQFSTQFSNDIDNMDTRKIYNSAENLSINSNGQNLVIERRTELSATDTIYYQLTGVSNQNYRFIFTASGIENTAVNGFIVDSYTKKETPLNSDGDTQLDFTVTSDAASKVANRFKIIFRNSTTTPVTFTSVKANAHNNQVSVDWNVENQSKMKQYEVERSANGNKFSTVAVINANDNLSFSYSWLDENPFQGNNFYRIRSVDLNGKIEYTSVVKAQISDISVSIKVYPNPATEAKVNVQFNNQPAGVYYARLINPIGQVIVSKKIVHTAGTSTETIQWNQNAARGIYNLQVTQPDGSMKVIKIEY